MRAVIIIFFSVALTLAVLKCLDKSKSDTELRLEYDAWTSTFHYYPSFSQWKSMKENRLLPLEPKPVIPPPISR